MGPRRRTTYQSLESSQAALRRPENSRCQRIETCRGWISSGMLERDVANADADGSRPAPPTKDEVAGSLQLLIDTIRDYAIFILDPAGHVLTWNPGAEAIKGYEAAE